MLSIKHGIAAACLCLGACGNGGTSSGNSGTGLASYGSIQLLSHEPADTAVQVAAGAVVRLRFDASMVLDCMRDPDTWLRVAGATTTIPGDFALSEGGSTVTFTPATPLEAETDYEFQVSPLTCDQDGRILETAERFTFRTIDTTPPHVVTSNVVPGQTGRSRTSPVTVTFDESIASPTVSAATVVLRDSFGQRIACERTVQGALLTVRPLADLPGDRQMTLQVAAGVTDRAGNALGTAWSITFRTAIDTIAPAVTSWWPPQASTGMSPLLQPIVTFNESMDPATVEPSSVLFQDEFGSLVAFAVHSSDDQRTLRVRPLAPLQPDRNYTLAFLVSAAAVTDVSGNGLGSTLALSFRTGTDTTPPSVASMAPQPGAVRVSVDAEPLLTFAEAMDPNWISAATVQLEQDGLPVSAVVARPGAAVVTLLPVLPLAPARTYRVRVRGGHDGVRDVAGNVLAADWTADFTTTDDATLPSALVLPPDGAVGVSPTAHISVVFDSPVDPDTVDTSTCKLLADDQTPLPATVTLRQDGRVVAIAPSTTLTSGAYYRVLVRGGPTGVREPSGNWLGDDLRARFRAGFGGDSTPPQVTATVNGIAAARRTGVQLPPSGFSIDVVANDGSQYADMGSVAIELTGPAAAPSPAALFASATVDHDSLQTFVPAATPLAPGAWTMTVRVADQSGNVGSATAIEFNVLEPDSGMVPFERTQVVWARTDLDRDGSGVSDFDEDMLRLGLATAGDPHGTNAWVRKLMLDAILARANQLYGRGVRGEPLGRDSVAIRFTTHQPIAIPHMQMALGGLDPEGQRGRRFGDDSTGVLGRAYYDYRNAQVADRNTATSPGLGVFPAEMFLYQARLHLNVYPLFQTMFAQRYLPLCPEMGGTPAGSHPLDEIVLQPTFDSASATNEQFARWLVVMRAIDDWAVVTGTVLAHEVGHSIGLVAPGPAPGGLFGDSSLHNTNSSAAEVMAAAVGYESMLTLEYGFRDINLAYLRHRILLR